MFSLDSMVERSMSVDEGESKDSHWVETLFPPHFSFQSLVGNKQSTGLSEKTGVRAAWSPATQSYQQSSGRWVKASLRVQEREKQRKDKLIKRISTDDSVERQHHVDDSDPTPHQMERVTGGPKEGDKSSCIWTNQDIDAFRKVLRSMEEDQGRLRSQLRVALVELRGQADIRRKMEALLEENEQRLVKAKQDATLWAVNMKALQAEGHRLTVRLDMEAEHVKNLKEDKIRLEERLRMSTKEAQDVRRENRNLTWDIIKLRNNRGTEMDRQEKTVKLERDLALQRLQMELDDTKAQLQKERDSHTRTYTALDLLRRHFNTQSHDREQEKPLDKISHS